MSELALLTTLEREGVVTVGGNPVTLLGNETKQGDPAPDFTALNTDMKPVSLSDFRGKVIVLATVGSFDTGTCDTEGNKFNEKIGEFGDSVACIFVSCDLPFAQKRWCGAHGIENLMTLSDYRDHSCGLNYGMLVKESKLLARAIFVIDQDWVVRYVQIVPEVAHEPEYDPVIDEVRDLLDLN